MKNKSRLRAWFLPLALMLPIVVSTAIALSAWGAKIRDLISIAIKLAVIS